MNPTEILSEFTTVLTTQGIQYAVIGGLASGYWGKQRFTKDIDFTICLDNTTWNEFAQALANIPDLQIISLSRDEGESLPYLIRIIFKGYPIDMLVAKTAYQEEVVRRGLSVNFAGHSAVFATPEDIVILKMIANRPQDIADVIEILLNQKDLDTDYIQLWAKSWETESIWKDLLARISR